MHSQNCCLLSLIWSSQQLYQIAKNVKPDVDHESRSKQNRKTQAWNASGVQHSHPIRHFRSSKSVKRGKPGLIQPVCRSLRHYITNSSSSNSDITIINSSSCRHLTSNCFINNSVCHSFIVDTGIADSSDCNSLIWCLVSSVSIVNVDISARNITVHELSVLGACDHFLSDLQPNTHRCPCLVMDSFFLSLVLTAWCGSSSFFNNSQH